MPFEASCDAPRTVMAIREYTSADAHDVVLLARALQAHEAARFDRMKPADAIGPSYVEALLQKCREHGGAFLVALVDRRLVGYATVVTRLPIDELDEVAYLVAHVGDLVVAEEARGRGVGRALLAECERRAREAGRDEIRVDVLARNDRARRVYEVAGFTDLLITLRKRLE